jgi:hypothetical protein
MLCRVLHVNRSTYYNFINKKPSKREIENQRLRKHLLEIYMKAKKRIGTRAFKIILLRDYGINISEGRILRLLKAMTLPNRKCFYKMCHCRGRWTSFTVFKYRRGSKWRKKISRYKIILG